MRIAASAISLNVDDVTASATFAKQYFGFSEEMSATEPWGERYFQVTDPNGVVIQLVQWMNEPDSQA
jgi:uncharacterized glyoxalase superfamily protein PhnB